MIGNTLFNNIASMKNLNLEIRNQIEDELPVLYIDISGD